MRTLDELCGVLDGLGIEWANEKFSNEETPAPPYIVLEAGFEDAAYADNAAWARWMPYEILLYTQQRDYAAEGKIGAALDGAGIAYTKSVAHYDGESLVEASFSVNVTE